MNLNDDVTTGTEEDEIRLQKTIKQQQKRKNQQQKMMFKGKATSIAHNPRNEKDEDKIKKVEA